MNNLYKNKWRLALAILWLLIWFIPATLGELLNWPETGALIVADVLCGVIGGIPLGWVLADIIFPL